MDWKSFHKFGALSISAEAVEKANPLDQFIADICLH
jgi:hypothetical protein